jgi:hypothetical protein
VKRFAFVFLASCGARTEIAAPVTCTVQCGGGEVCIHQYNTHDPPPPLVDGGTCTFGIQRFDRCWGEEDRCAAVPQGCTSDPCTCPPLDPKWQQTCACAADGTFDCYTIGI